MNAYTISTANQVWDITNSSTGNGNAATINTGRAFYVGNSTSDTLSNLDPGTKIGQFHGTKVVIPAGVATQGGPTGILAAGNFATMTAGAYVMKRVTTELAGISNTFLQSGAAYPGGLRSIHKLETVRTTQVATAIRAGYWNIFSGTFSSGPNSTEDATTPSTNNQLSAFDQQAGTGATSGVLDAAANPTQAIPGELVITEGDPLPTLADYSARTTW